MDEREGDVERFAKSITIFIPSSFRDKCSAKCGISDEAGEFSKE